MDCCGDVVKEIKKKCHKELPRENTQIAELKAQLQKWLSGVEQRLQLLEEQFDQLHQELEDSGDLL